MNTIEIKNATAKPITESVCAGERDRTMILASVEFDLTDNRILFPSPEKLNRLVGEVLLKIWDEKNEKARKIENKIDEVCYQKGLRWERKECQLIANVNKQHHVQNHQSGYIKGYQRLSEAIRGYQRLIYRLP